MSSPLSQTHYIDRRVEEIFIVIWILKSACHVGCQSSCGILNGFIFFFVISVLNKGNFQRYLIYGFLTWPLKLIIYLFLYGLTSVISETMCEILTALNLVFFKHWLSSPFSNNYEAMVFDWMIREATCWGLSADINLGIPTAPNALIMT